jgi:glycosyltransferase involved in cell wall biosynthesis
MRGGEKVLQSVLRLFPGAPIHTLLHVPGSVSRDIEERAVHTTFVQRLPAVDRHYRNYLPLFPLAVETMDMRPYDLVVSTSHCVVKSVRPRPGAVHVCYCHTPMRYIWDRYDDYFGPGKGGAIARALMPLLAPLLRRWDARTASRVTAFVANSAYVAARIRRYYGREAAVIPPPVDTEFFTPGDGRPGAYDLVVSALVPYKRLEVVLEAYRGTGWPLRIVGSGPERPRLEALAPPEVRFVGSVGDEELRELYRNCRAVLMPGIEDFGIVPVEAMACGRPAVVFGEGGAIESVVHGETGLHFHDPSPAGLRTAVDSLSRMGFNTAALRARAESFRRQMFEDRFRAFVDDTLRGAGPR